MLIPLIAFCSSVTSSETLMVGTFKETYYNPSIFSKITIKNTDESVASATLTNGWFKITGIKIGTTTITVTGYNNGSGGVATQPGNFTRTINVSVIDVTSISIPNSLSLAIGDSYTFSPQISHPQATTTLIWNSSNTSIATINSEGVLNTLNIGTTTITCTAHNGVTAQCVVTVNPILATGISLNQTEITLEENASTQLTATVSPGNATNKDVIWSSSNEGIAIVSSSGRVTAIAEGTCNIIANTADGSNKSVTCLTRVVKPTVLATSVSLSQTLAQLYAGESLQLSATVSPLNTTNATINWSSSNPAVAMVNDNGLVTAVGTGTAFIYATTTDGSNKSAQCGVTVSPVLVSDIALSQTEVSLDEGTTTQLSANITPGNATNKNVIWSSTDETVATVDANGLVTAVAEGDCNIIARAEDASGVEATCQISVKKAVVLVTSISLNETKVELQDGDTFQLTATVLPTNATNKSLYWKTSDGLVASIDQDGKVTNLYHPGSAVISVWTTDGSNLHATCEMTFNPIPPTSIKFEQSEVTLEEGQSANLDAHYTPRNTSRCYYGWTYSSSNEEVATIKSGWVKAIAEGVCTITVQAPYGNLSDVCTVRVVKKNVLASSISLDQTQAQLQEGETLQLLASVLPENTSNTELDWTSSNQEVATVNSTGTITAISAGVATITATTTDGSNISAECEVTVMQQETEQEVEVTDISQLQNAIYFEPLEALTGSELVATVELKNAIEVGGYSFDFVLPEGVSVAKNAKGKFTATLIDDRHDEHSISVNYADGYYSVAVLSLGGGELSGNDGGIISLPLVVSSDMPEGTYPIEIRNVKFSTPAAVSVAVPNVTTSITVSDVQLGDVNQDGQIDIADAIGIVNRVVRKDSATFIEKAADVNGDGQVDIADAIAVVNIVVRKSSGARQRKAHTDNLDPQ